MPKFVPKIGGVTGALTFTAPVEMKLPSEVRAGATEKVSFDVTMEVLTATRQAALGRAIAAELLRRAPAAVAEARQETTDAEPEPVPDDLAELVKELPAGLLSFDVALPYVAVRGWGRVSDPADENAEWPFTRANLLAVLDVPTYRIAINRTYTDALNKGVVKGN